MWNKDLFKWENGILGYDLSIRGVERDLVGVCVTFALLIGDRDNLFLFILGFKNEISVYWKLPLEDALVWALGMNQVNFVLEIKM